MDCLPVAVIIDKSESVGSLDSHRKSVFKMGISDIGRISIPFHFNGCVITLKVTKFSTYDDVIHMILHMLNLPVSKVTLYAVFERTSSVERMLPGKSLVYKVYMSWGCENANFQFHIKSKHAKVQCLGIKRNLGNPSAEGDIDGIFMNHYNRKTEHARLTELEQRNKNLSAEYEIDGLFMNHYTRKTEHARSSEIEEICKASIMHHPEPTCDMHSERNRVPLKLHEDSLNKHDSSTRGKQIVLTRLMYDIASRSTIKLRNKKRLPAREHGNRTERDYLCCRQGDGSKSYHIYIRPNKIQSLHSRCICFLEQKNMKESESNNDSIGNLSLADYDHMIFPQDAAKSLDMAFLKSSAGSDSDEGIDVTSVDSDFDLDVAFNKEFHITNSRENTSPSKSQYSFEYKNVLRNNTLEKNVCADNLVKELFGRDHYMSEDEAMDSFMRSRVDYF